MGEASTQMCCAHTSSPHHADTLGAAAQVNRAQQEESARCMLNHIAWSHMIPRPPQTRCKQTKCSDHAARQVQHKGQRACHCWCAGVLRSDTHLAHCWAHLSHVSGWVPAQRCCLSRMGPRAKLRHTRISTQQGQHSTPGLNGPP